MKLNEPVDHIVTFNHEIQPREELVVSTMDYEHPMYTPESVSIQKKLPVLNDNLIAFAGAYHGCGFREDG